MPADAPISHALVLPDQNFYQWLAMAKTYLKAFADVTVVRSPSGSDLNRFRNVSAVEAPLTWMGDSALQHIRRVFPRVVRVDVIAAKTPEDLPPILQRRVQQKDRYGLRQSPDEHIHERFVLEWMTSARPMQLLAAYNAKGSAGDLREGVDLRSSPNADVLCGAAGEVTALAGAENTYRYRPYLQVESLVDGQRYITIYEGVRAARVKPGDRVKAGQKLAKSLNERLRIVLRNPPNARDSFPRIKNVLNPRDYIYIPDFKLKPLVDRLRVRVVPSMRAKIKGDVFSWDLLEPLEHHGRAMEKIGVVNKWLKARSIGGLEGYVAAWHVLATTGAEGRQAFPGVNPVGVNLDVYHPLGKPNPSRLGALGWLRFGYNVSNFRGSEDINAALQRYLPLIERYRAAGYRVVFTTSHQTYGEGRSQFWPWSQMTDAKWTQLSERFAEMMAGIARQWAGRGLVAAWQIWNEQDAPQGAVASVPMSVANYARMFERAHAAIRSADSRVQIITGGFTGGPGRGSRYARRLVQLLPNDRKPDGIAFHPYGRGLNSQPKYAIFGHIDESVWAYSPVMPHKPLWMTEWGVLDRPNDDVEHIARYATEMIQHLKVNYPGKFAAMIWYAWAQGMHNGYGLVDGNSNPRPPLTERFLSS